jgi:hypothetical protein
MTSMGIGLEHDSQRRTNLMSTMLTIDILKNTRIGEQRNRAAQPQRTQVYPNRRPLVEIVDEAPGSSPICLSGKNLQIRPQIRNPIELKSAIADTS